MDEIRDHMRNQGCQKSAPFSFVPLIAAETLVKTFLFFQYRDSRAVALLRDSQRYNQ